ncbi:MAG: SGNH/GDSL hydrolase family protein [Ruminococcus sp.]|nr:SGNH/GDSL hydrolase family protein [Ruminococcus sp.]
MKKRFLMLCISLVFTLTTLMPISVFADKAQIETPVPSKLTVMGDSIAAGFGLQGYSKKDLSKCRSYANILAEMYTEELKDECGFELANVAVSGDTSTQLLEHIQKGQFDDALKDSNCVIISIGGNDVLELFLEFLRDNMQLNKDSKLKDVVDQVSDLKVVLDGLNDLKDKMDVALEGFENNLEVLIDEIQSRTDGVIIFQTLYDPLNGYDHAFMFQGISKDKIGKLDEIIKEHSVDENGSTRYLVCDIYEAFYEKGTELTNIKAMDIHPNAAGHELIAKCLDETVRTQTYTYEPKDDELSSGEDTAASASSYDKSADASGEAVPEDVNDDDSDKIRLGISIAAVALAGGAVAVLILTREKKKK